MADASLRMVRLLLEYDGTGLAGWQRQKDRLTVQGHVEAALARLTGEAVAVHGASRTDAGVHAQGQVAHFKTRSAHEPAIIQRALNALLPDQIAVLAVEDAPAWFHARYNAKSKVYEYRLRLSPTPSALGRRYAWHIPYALDLAAMERALSGLVGEHDFAAFRSVGSPVKSTVRRMIAARIETGPERRTSIILEANGFLRHMVRAIVGTLIEVGRGGMSPERFFDVLEAGDRALAGATAPAHGLCLREVRYDQPLFGRMG